MTHLKDINAQSSGAKCVILHLALRKLYTSIDMTFGAAAGFYTQFEERDERSLKIHGRIPDGVEGVLYRTGPGRFEVESSDGNTITITH